MNNIAPLLKVIRYVENKLDNLERDFRHIGLLSKEEQYCSFILLLIRRAIGKIIGSKRM